MSRVIDSSIGVSIDGFSAGPDQSLEHPLGVGGPALMEWAFTSGTIQQMVFGSSGGATGADDVFAARGFANMGAWIVGRNMFGPSRGPWPHDDWKGWWGTNPPYHVPAFVLTHHARESIVMEGGTTFHFVTGGIHVALARAKHAAGNRNVRVGGGVSTLRQFVHAGPVDEIHLALGSALLGSGEPLLVGIDLPALGYACTEHVGTAHAMHVVLTTRACGTTMTPPIDLRSDTVTRPTKAMRAARASAPVGDDQIGEDPTTNRLQARLAELLGKEAALWLPTGTTANQVALRVLTRPGDGVIATRESHAAWHEAGGGAANAGVQIHEIGQQGVFTADEMLAAVKPRNFTIFSATTLVEVENTHNRAGGVVVPQAEVLRLCAAARDHGLASFPDCARLWNESVASGQVPADIAAPLDLVAVAFSKGLGAHGD